MHHVSSPMPQGIGGHSRISHLVPKTDSILPPDIRGAQGPRLDHVHLSDRARIHVAARSITGTGGGLTGPGREAQQFLDQHPRMANSPFGKAVALLIRGAAHLAHTEPPRDLPDDGEATLTRAIETVESFLARHPRVAEAPIGRSAAALAQGIASAIREAGDNAGARRIDYLLAAAKKADLYLGEHPKLAGMPLGQVVEKLVDGVTSLADGNPLDADLQTLAKRVGHFVQNHPRLADSEFGQIVSHLVQGFPVPGTAPPPATTEAEAAPAVELMSAA